MASKINLELSLETSTREAARAAGLLTALRRLLLAYPPAAGVVNRVAHCIGAELCAPGATVPLLVATWTLEREPLRQAEVGRGINHPDYLVDAMRSIMAPLDAALDLRVAAPDGALWIPEKEPHWSAWRAAHPGTLTVSARTGDEDNARRLDIEMWALGPRFTQVVTATSQWPKVIGAQ